jgi:hypothetical protein
MEMRLFSLPAIALPYGEFLANRCHGRQTAFGRLLWSILVDRFPYASSALLNDHTIYNAGCLTVRYKYGNEKFFHCN